MSQQPENVFVRELRSGDLYGVCLKGIFIRLVSRFGVTPVLEELDGQLIQSFELDPKSRSSAMIETIDAVARRMQFEDLLYSIILVKGVWHIDRRSLIGYISINNAPAWRKMYQDIEIDAETRVSGEDFADVVLARFRYGRAFC